MKNLVIKDNDFYCLIKENSNLITLNISGCKMISNKTIDNIIENCLKIKNLDLTNLKVLSEESKNKLNQKLLN